MSCSFFTRGDDPCSRKAGFHFTPHITFIRRAECWHCSHVSAEQRQAGTARNSNIKRVKSRSLSVFAGVVCYLALHSFDSF
ncbi:hypothetical protein HHUSO_G18650 [Huso huso]|uniref:Uncharacterized protein n=1 Tax=Huso huso TaxID=61971 RepID=A0ABR0Z7M9_HUSHU